MVHDNFIWPLAVRCAPSTLEGRDVLLGFELASPTCSPKNIDTESDPMTLTVNPNLDADPQPVMRSLYHALA